MVDEDKEEEEDDIETKAVHSGREIDPSTGAVSPPIHMSTTFERAEDGSYPKGYIYSRDDHPNRAWLEDCIADLEGGCEGAAFSSGSAAAMAVFDLLSPGDHVIAPSDVYHGTEHQLESLMGDWDVETTFVDMTDVEEVEENIRKDTELIWIETPSNPLLKITDIEKVCDLARENDILSVVDNTWSTPVIQRPLEHGADMVLHSTTKYFGGHSDAVGGALVWDDGDISEDIRGYQKHGGASPSPFDCWLTMRGVRTLALRMEKYSKNAMKIAEFLKDHENVDRVHYPGLKDHPGHEIAREQMDGYSGMLSFEVDGGKEEAMSVAANVDVFTRATSLGSVESLIEHRASIEGEGTDTPRNLLRLSVGIENLDDLIDDLSHALEKV